MEALKGSGDGSLVPRIEDDFEIDAEKSGEENTMNEQEDLVASLEEIEKLDAILKLKDTEEKKAKLSRIQTEEESRDVIRKLTCTKMPDRVKINLKQFMTLLSDVKTEPVSSPRCKVIEEDGTEEDESANKEEEKEGKESSQQQNMSSITFVERNIRLAKCGRGTLSLTDEEELRIENLLTDIEDPESKKTTKASTNYQLIKTDFENTEETYGIDVETKSVLTEIDQRLQALGKLKAMEKPQNVSDELDNNKPEKTASEESIKQTRDKGRKKEKKVSRLEEINALLASMNLVSNEEINPLSKEDMEGLLQRSKQSLDKEKGSGCLTGGMNTKPPQEVITKLVSGAKLLMPKFKYRFDDT